MCRAGSCSITRPAACTWLYMDVYVPALRRDPHLTRLVCMLQAESQPMEVMAEILSDAADTLQVCCILSTIC